MNVTITGLIKTIGEIETFETGLKKQFVTLKTIEEYPDVYDVDFLNDNIEKLKGFKVNKLVTVKARMTGREVSSKEDENKKYRIISLNGFTIADYE